MANLLATDAAGNLSFILGGNTTPSPAQAPPPGVSVMGARPASRVYQNRRYIVGLYSPGICYDEYGNFTPMGVPAPTIAPTIAAVAPTGTGVTGNAIGYLTFAYRVGAVIVAESNPSPPSSIVSLSNQARQWTLLPSGLPGSKANVIRGYVSMAGGIPLFAWERPIGVTSVTEQVPTANLGASLPVDTNGNLTFTNGVPPYAQILELYHDRMWYNDPTNPSYVWFSAIGAPEAVGALNFIQTRDREPVLSLSRASDVLIVQGQNCTYDLQGYAATDFNLRKISSLIGCINYHSCVNINEVLWFLSPYGIFTYNGATFRFMMSKVATYFRTDYLANRSLYESAIAAVDLYDNIYKLLLPVAGSATRPNYWCCPFADADPAMAGLYGAAPGSQGWGNTPVWHFDNRARLDWCMVQALAPGTNRGDFFTGSNDGYVRQENIESDAGDDGDAGNKTFSLTHGHNLLKHPDGDIAHGKQFQDLDVFGVFENAAASVFIFCGDESAALAPTKYAVGGATGIVIGPTFAAGTVPKEDYFTKLAGGGQTGRGYTFQITVPNAKGSEYRGHAITWNAGMQSRTLNA